MAVTILSMLKNIAAMKGRENLAGNTEPTETVALQFINEALLLTMGLLCPVRLHSNIVSAGALDKLKLLTETEDVAGTTTTEPSTIAFPSVAGTSICYFSSVFIKIDSGSYYPATEVDYATLIARKTGSNYPITASSPLFTYYDSTTIAVVPAGATSTTARWHYVEVPTIVTNASNFPLDDELVDPVLTLSLAAVMGRDNDPESEGIAQYFLSKYLSTIQDIIGLGFQPEKQ